jgi:hypothetical protein
VPLTAGGPLKIVTSSDLGPLGFKDGSPVAFTWVLPSIAPLLLPWLVILGLLALKPNRRPAAWLIWLPLTAVMALTLLPPIMPASASFLLDAIAALAFGLAAVWLLSNYLRRAHRLLTFFCVLPTLAAFSALAFVARQGGSWLEVETLQIGIFLALGALASTIALSLGGWICRSRYRPLGIYPWLFALLAMAWLLMSAPFFLFAVLASGGQIPWSEFFTPVLAVAAGNFVLLFPFLILSSSCAFFRERLKALLNVKLDIPPQLPATSLKT